MPADRNSNWDRAAGPRHRALGRFRARDLRSPGHVADVAEERAAPSKGVSRDERFDRLLLDMARMRRAPGETVETPPGAALSSPLSEEPPRPSGSPMPWAPGKS